MPPIKQPGQGFDRGFSQADLREKAKRDALDPKRAVLRNLTGDATRRSKFIKVTLPKIGGDK